MCKTHECLEYGDSLVALILALLAGPLIVARDIAHAKISELFEETGKLPQYVKAHNLHF